jgi:hypothetical protein
LSIFFPLITAAERESHTFKSGIQKIRNFFVLSLFVPEFQIELFSAFGADSKKLKGDNVKHYPPVERATVTARPGRYRARHNDLLNIIPQASAALL